MLPVGLDNWLLLVAWLGGAIGLLDNGLLWLIGSLLVVVVGVHFDRGGFGCVEEN